MITEEELTFNYILPKAFDERFGKAAADAVARAAKKTGVVKI